MRSTNTICPRSEEALRLSFPGPNDRDACLSRDMGRLWDKQGGGSGDCSWDLHCHSRHPLLPSIFIITPVCLWGFFWLHCEAWDLSSGPPAVAVPSLNHWGRALCVLVIKSCPTLAIPWTVPARLLCPWDSPGKNIGVLAISSSRGPFRPRNPICNSCISCIGRWILYHCTPWEAPPYMAVVLILT